MITNRFRNCIIVNSLIYFLLSYYLVAFSANLFIILLAKLVGFDAVLSYKGFVLSNGKWTNDNIIIVYFFGNLFSLIVAVFFLWKYYIINQIRAKIKILYLWIYIISLSWFFGEIIIGAVFKTGIGAALIAFEVPYFLRLLLAVIGVFALFFIGYKTRVDILSSANLYYPKLSSQKTTKFVINQILIPGIIGFIIIIILKLPNLGQYHYVDLLMLLSIGVTIAGVFYRFKKRKGITFKYTGKNITRNECSISYIPIIILICLLLIIRVGLNNGIII